RPGAAGDLLERPAVVVRAELVDRPTALLAEVVGQLVGGDREEVRLQVPLLVVVRQAGQEADEGLLDHVLAGRTVAETAVDERDQPPFEPLDQLTPGAGVPFTNLSDQEGFGVRCGHRFVRPSAYVRGPGRRDYSNPPGGDLPTPRSVAIRRLRL